MISTTLKPAISTTNLNLNTDLITSEPITNQSTSQINEATSTAADTSITNTIENTSNLNAYSTLLLSSSTLADRIN
ncbi:unnamed protein product, partial [Rotaria magnacalcarata]